MIKKFFIFKKYVLILLLFFSTSKVYSEQIKNIVINGNQRVANETIIMFSNLEIGLNINQNLLNESLKELYKTNYFSDVKIINNNGEVIIEVKENPIIQSIIINGIKKNKIYETVEEITLKIEKYPFIESKINEQVNLLKNILKSYGYYFVKLNTSIEVNENNTINLVYDFDLGEIAKIQKIKFIGNKIFRDSTLRNIIVSEESKFWKFITSNKFLDANRIGLDVSRLQKFYLNRGYYDVKIKSTTTLITEKNQFELIFNIDSGNKYQFGEVKIEENSDLSSENLIFFQKKFSKLEGKKYSQKKILSLIDELNDFTLQNDFIFINADFTEIVKSDDKINIVVNFKETEKNYVQRINILGNYITDEKVIRNNLIVDEGDPFNKILFEKSIANIKAKNIFSNVNYEVISEKDQEKIINLTVEEKATGEIFAGAGTGTTGTSFTAGIKENNYLGLGIKLDTNVTLTDDSIKGKFSVINPNYNNSDKSIKTSIESSTNDFMTSSGYKTSRTGITIGTEFEQFSDLYVNLELSNFYEDLETSSNATNIVKKQEGNYFENLLTYSITFNKLDQNFQPTDGFLNNFSQTLPIYSDDVSIENQFTSSVYRSLSDNLILSAKIYLKAINSVDDNVRISKRVYVPGRLLRGFESGKIGPKDGSQFIGGNYAAAMNLNSTLPNILFENENIDLNYFIDLANVWEVDYNSSLDSNKIRSSSGIAVNWFSPIGPLTFSYAVPLSESNTDITERFRFRIGTSF
jgi:outer membrane protein insertion porin family